MRDRLLFVDPVAREPYGAATLRARAMGGTEATVLRVAHALARRWPVAIAQRARAWPETGPDGVAYLPWSADAPRVAGGAAHVVVLRSHKVLKRIRRAFPDSALYLWMHCMPGRHARDLAACAARHDATVIAVSDWHRREMERFFGVHDPLAARRCRFVTLYNPIADDLQPDHRGHARDRLLYLSSPHKGLEQVLRAFHHCRAHIPSLALEVGNPGYLACDVRAPGVTFAGALRHDQAIARLRRSLCLFYPQTRFCETFGLVLAEANAVGTPVLAHPIGAAAEVLDDPAAQLVDCRDLDAVLARVARWRHDRPRVRAHPRFRLSQVTRAWEAALGMPIEVRRVP